MIKKLLIAGMIVVLGGFAQAQDSSESANTTVTGAEVANNSRFGDWIVACEAITVSKNVCRLMQELTLTENNALVARFITFAGKEGDAILLAQVPIGVFLPGGAVYRIAEDDTLEQREMIWQRCLGELCEAAINLSAEEIELFGEKGAILFGYRSDANAEPIIVRVDTSEFPAAVAAITDKN
tara:strand:- start:19147 stop:19692 length:546 start_codon:yes stop_codon:yes gene_type:complete